ncbi:hypothetical protein [Streptomyces gobitricini]|uniref:PH domain-containing protein n=1 Tax=Streptomyces gobitricini TaxID=68211 RepID=A0ABN3MQ45_9ACTN
MDDRAAYRLQLAPGFPGRVPRQALAALAPTALFSAYGVWVAGDLTAAWLLVVTAASFSVSLFAVLAAHVGTGTLRVDEDGITAGRRELIPWDDIRFVVLHGRVLQVRLHRHGSSQPLVNVHNDGYGLGRERHAERQRAIVGAVEYFAPGRYVADRQRVLRELGQ